MLVQVFMQSNFALEDPEIFNHVLPWNMVTQETKGGMREAPSYFRCTDEQCACTFGSKISRIRNDRILSCDP